MDTLFSEKKLSPGGSADLLAVTVFLYLLTQASG
ncbi:triphosphoribosyl-dephospho-CoA synthase [Aminivibrio sp.]